MTASFIILKQFSVLRSGPAVWAYRDASWALFSASPAYQGLPAVTAGLDETGKLYTAKLGHINLKYKIIFCLVLHTAVRGWVCYVRHILPYIMRKIYHRSQWLKGPAPMVVVITCFFWHGCPCQQLYISTFYLASTYSLLVVALPWCTHWTLYHINFAIATKFVCWISHRNTNYFCWLRESHMCLTYYGFLYEVCKQAI